MTTTTTAQRHLLERLGGAATVLFAHHLKLDVTPEWCGGVDADGHAVHLVGAHALTQLPAGEEYVHEVLAALKIGEWPPGVRPVRYAPMASIAYVEILDGPGVDEVLVDGPRQSGKTQLEPAAMGGLAELHAQAGFPLPLKVLWLHSALINARMKTVESLQQAHWGGAWTFEDDKQTAVLTVGGVQMVRAFFVGTQDATAQERARAECHVVFGEEMIPSLDESGGIDERTFDLAKNSARLPTRRRIAVAVTNPGDPATWLYRRFIEGGGRDGCLRCPVPASDRLTPEEERQQIADFATSPDLQARLGRGEWAALLVGERIAEGYDGGVHVAPHPLRPDPGHLLVLGWDGGHTPSTVIGQVIGGQVRVYAALNSLKLGVLEHIEDQVIPWLTTWAPWTRERRGGGRGLQHVIDPSMKTGSEHSIRESSEKTILEMLGGRMDYGPQEWPPRREAVLRVLATRHEEGVLPVLIAPGPETALLRTAFEARWIYAQTADGRVDRSRARKPNSPWSDVADASAYLFGWLQPGRIRPRKPRRDPPKHARSSVEWSPYDYTSWGRRRA